MARGHDPFGSRGVRTEAPVPCIEAFSSIEPQCVRLENAVAAEPAVGTALNSPESESLSRLYRRGGAEDLRTSPHPDEGEPPTGWGDFSERAGRPSEANGGMMSMAKEYRTAGELSGMVMSALAVKDVASRFARITLTGGSRSSLHLPGI
jgi:hypothetical protein